MSAHLKLCPPPAPPKSDFGSGWVEGFECGQRSANHYFFIYGAIVAIFAAVILILAVKYFGG